MEQRGTDAYLSAAGVISHNAICYCLISAFVQMQYTGKSSFKTCDMTCTVVVALFTYLRMYLGISYIMKYAIFSCLRRAHI